LMPLEGRKFLPSISTSSSVLCCHHIHERCKSFINIFVHIFMFMFGIKKHKFTHKLALTGWRVNLSAMKNSVWGSAKKWVKVQLNYITWCSVCLPFPWTPSRFPFFHFHHFWNNNICK
jgi:hypothetical protein